jgi:hypothetical protein
MTAKSNAKNDAGDTNERQQKHRTAPSSSSFTVQPPDSAPLIHA